MGALKLLVTGASGRIGQAVLAEAHKRGFDLRALSRSGDPQPGVTMIQADLASDALQGAVEGVDAVIHLAARIAGSEPEITRDTETGTARLIEACEQTGAPHFVLAGSVAVYGLSPLDEGYVVNEDTFLEANPAGRDAYTRSKLAQEALLAQSTLPSTILRIGAVWGPGQLWNAHLGVAKGPLLIRMGSEGQIPLAHLSRVAEALVTAAKLRGAEPVLNIVDDDLPNRQRYLTTLQQTGWPKMVLPINWRLIDMIAADSGRRFGLLNSPTLHARMKPVAWSGKRAKAALSLSDQPGFDTLMSEALAAEGQT